MKNLIILMSLFAIVACGGTVPVNWNNNHANHNDNTTSAQVKPAITSNVLSEHISNKQNRDKTVSPSQSNYSKPTTNTKPPAVGTSHRKPSGTAHFK